MDEKLELEQAYIRLSQAAARHINAIDELAEAEQQHQLAADRVDCLEERFGISAPPVTAEKP